MCVLLTLALTGWVAYRHYTSPDQVRAMAVKAIHDATGAQAVIGDAAFEISGSLTLREVTLIVPGMRGQAARLLDAPLVILRFDPWALPRGKFNITHVNLPQTVTLYVTEDLATGRYGFQNLQPKQGEMKSGVVTVPEVTVTQADIVMGQTRGDAYEETQRVSVTGQIAPASGNPGYEFVLQQINAAEDPAPRLGGTLNLDKLAFTAWIDHFSFAGWQRQLIPHTMRSWWDRLEPTGRIPMVRIGYNPDPRVGIYAQFDVRDLEVNIPHETVKVRTVIDEASVSIDRAGVRVSDLKGRIQDIALEVSAAAIEGFEPEAKMSLSLSMKGPIPGKPPLLEVLPQVLRKTMDRFGPVGTFVAEVKAQRETDGGPLILDGQVEFTASHMLDQENPYPMTDVRGKLKLTPERLTLDIDAKGPTGAVITVKGVIEPPMADRPAFDFAIHAADVPMDEHAWGALNEKQTKVVKGILDAEAHATLVEAGLIHTPASKAAADAALAKAEADAQVGAGVDEKELVRLRQLAARPVFELGGKLDADIRFLKEPGPDKKGVTTVAIDMAGMNVLVTPWPYPLTLDAGKLIIEGREVKLVGVEARGVSRGVDGGAGGQGKFDGVFAPASDENPRILPDLNFTASDLPVDDLLIASLPKGPGQWVASFGVEGRVDFQGRIFPREDKQGHTFAIATHLHDATATPFAGKYALEKLDAKLLLKPDDFLIESLEAAHGETKLALRGEVLWRERKPDLQLSIQALALNLDDPVADLLPPAEEAMDQARTLLANYKPSGVVDLDLQFNTSPGDKERKFSLRLSPKTLAFDLPSGARVKLSDVTGDIFVIPGWAKFDQFAATLGAAKVGLEGVVATGGAMNVDVDIDAAGWQLDEAMLAVLPAQVAATLRGLEVQGAYAMREAKFKIVPAEQGQSLDFTAKVSLDDARAVVGVPVTKIKGVMDIAVRQKLDEASPQVTLALDAEQLRVLDRFITTAHGELRPLGRDDLYALEKLQGKIYGGTVAGQGNLRLGKEGWYRLKLAMEDVALEPATHPEKDDAWRAAVEAAAGDEKAEVPPGKFTASLNIEGRPSEPASKRGRGEINIREAKFYQVPLVMTMLQLINLSLPGSNSFDRVIVGFAIEGDIVRLDPLSFEAKNVQITGSGTMDYNTHKLDLEMYSRNPRFRLGVLSDAFDMIKNELVMIKVGGTLEEPKAGVQPLSSIKRSIGDIFGGGDETNAKPPLKPNR